MEIQGPFSLSVIDNSETGARELHLAFKPAFQQLELEQRINMMKDHLVSLQKDIEASTDDANRQGMLTIFQVGSELLPHLEADEIPLEETIVIEIGPSQASPFDELLRGATLK